MTTMNVIQDAARSLREGQWNDYKARVMSAYRVDNEKIWTQLAAEHPQTVNVIAALTNQPADSRASACEWLLPVVGLLDSISVDEALALLDFADFLDLSHRYMPAEQLKPHITAQSVLGRQLGQIMRTRTEPKEACLIVWAGAFSSGASQEAVQYAAELLTGTPVDTQLFAHLLNNLPATDDVVRKTLEPVETEVAGVLVSNIGELGYLGWSALCCVAVFSPTARSQLQAALNAGEQHAVLAIANTLYRTDNPLAGVTGTPVVDIVSRLLEIALSDPQCRARIDAAVNSLFFRTSLKPVVVQCVKNLRSTEGAIELFGETFGALARHPIEFAQVLTDWLLHPDASFNSIRGLLSLCTTSQAQVGLDEIEFAAQSPQQRTNAARRLLALTHHGPTLCKYIATIAEMSTLGTERFALAGQMFDLAFAEYPGATEEFLKKKTVEISRTAPEAHVFRGVYSNTLRWRRVLERLPKRKELLPSDTDLQTLRTRKQRINREIMRIAAERSIFRDVVTNMHIVQGRKFSTRTKFGQPQITEMRQTSHFVELPSSELADPMRGQLERNKLLRNAR